MKEGLPRSHAPRVLCETKLLLVETDDMNDEIDAAYRAKYHRYAESIVGPAVATGGNRWQMGLP